MAKSNNIDDTDDILYSLTDTHSALTNPGGKLSLLVAWAEVAKLPVLHRFGFSHLLCPLFLLGPSLHLPFFALALIFALALFCRFNLWLHPLVAATHPYFL